MLQLRDSTHASARSGHLIARSAGFRRLPSKKEDQKKEQIRQSAAAGSHYTSSNYKFMKRKRISETFRPRSADVCLLHGDDGHRELHRDLIPNNLFEFLGRLVNLKVVQSQSLKL